MIRHCFVLLVLFLLFSCRKNNEPLPIHLLGTNGYGSTLMIHQALIVYDSTAITDTGLYLHPPANRIYSWSVSPDSAGVRITGNYLNGEPEVSFNHSGVYMLSARILDPVSSREVAKTDSFVIVVTADTLYPEVALLQSDQLTLNTLIPITPDTATAPESSSTINQFLLQFVTTGGYPANSGIPCQVSQANGVYIAFSDSATLPSYPFLYWGNGTVPAVSGAFIQNFTVGSTQPFSVAWFNQTYTGAISRTGALEFTFTWNSSWPVKISSNYSY
jgi:hypothetical protein